MALLAKTCINNPESPSPQCRPSSSSCTRLEKVNTGHAEQDDTHLDVFAVSAIKMQAVIGGTTISRRYTCTHSHLAWLVSGKHLSCAYLVHIQVPGAQSQHTVCSQTRHAEHQCVPEGSAQCMHHNTRIHASMTYLDPNPSSQRDAEYDIVCR
jgi:hypothetical protein